MLPRVSVRGSAKGRPEVLFVEATLSGRKPGKTLRDWLATEPRIWS
jgi:hypothetical protein